MIAVPSLVRCMLVDVIRNGAVYAADRDFNAIARGMILLLPDGRACGREAPKRQLLAWT